MTSITTPFSNSKTGREHPNTTSTNHAIINNSTQDYTLAINCHSIVSTWDCSGATTSNAASSSSSNISLIKCVKPPLNKSKQQQQLQDLVVDDFAWNHNGLVLATTYSSSPSTTTPNSTQDGGGIGGKVVLTHAPSGKSLEQIDSSLLLQQHSSATTSSSLEQEHQPLGATSISFGCKSRYLSVSSSTLGTIFVWDTKRKAKVRTFNVNNDDGSFKRKNTSTTNASSGVILARACWDPSDSFIAGLTLSTSKKVDSTIMSPSLKLFKVREGKLTASLQTCQMHKKVANNSSVASLPRGVMSGSFAFSSIMDNYCAVGCPNNGTVLLWDVGVSKNKVASSDCTPLSTMSHQHTGHVTGVSFSPLNKALVGTVSNDGTLVFHDVQSRATIQVLRPLSSLSQNNNNGALCSVKEDGNASASDCLTCIDFHSDGFTCATGSSDGFVTLYDLRNATKGPLATWNVHSEQQWQRPSQQTNESGYTIDVGQEVIPVTRIHFKTNTTAKTNSIPVLSNTTSTVTTTATTPATSQNSSNQKPVNILSSIDESNSNSNAITTNGIHKVTAMATTTNTPIATAKDATLGMQQQQQHLEMDKNIDNNNDTSIQNQSLRHKEQHLTNQCNKSQSINEQQQELQQQLTSPRLSPILRSSKSSPVDISSSTLDFALSTKKKTRQVLFTSEERIPENNQPTSINEYVTGPNTTSDVVTIEEHADVSFGPQQQHNTYANSNQNAQSDHVKRLQETSSSLPNNNDDNTFEKQFKISRPAAPLFASPLGKQRQPCGSSSDRYNADSKIVPQKTEETQEKYEEAVIHHSAELSRMNVDVEAPTQRHEKQHEMKDANITKITTAIARLGNDDSDGTVTNSNNTKVGVVNSNLNDMKSISSGSNQNDFMDPTLIQRLTIQQTVKESMEELRDEFGTKLQNFHVDMLRQFQHQSDEMNALFKMQQEAFKGLVKENQELKEENERLKSVY
eukprot:CAMPEP_0194400478 /NCGR_PEP_ID=MMETSP0174-20130528/127252_1 /TAXON_ID=216777 /ORGANISM="Proboscia alata, Strain PI-D3" /LENGTH=965 /DNA_ID=CAMNT_0039197031 /DNA_START=39 /DNA_END=2936 /DNA_ORIENTATION=-